MSRPPRVLSKTGLYHIVFRGINRQNIFEEEKDFQKMIEIIDMVKSEKKFEIYAYCLMTNHVHLFIKEQNSGDIKKIMHKLLTRYVGWYNFKYQRSGSLIGNRYKSEPIEDESYYLTLVRYIHQNPIKAGIVENIKDYRWSSYNDYIKLLDRLTDKDFTLSLFSKRKKTAVNLFKEFHMEIGKEEFVITGGKRLTEEQVKRKIRGLTGGVDANEISQKPKAERNKIIASLREAGLTIGQLERATGISRGIITRAKNI